MTKRHAPILYAMPASPLRAVVIGCGHVAKAYGDQIATYDSLTIVGAYDLDAARAKEFTDKYGGKVYESLEAIADDPDIDLVVNLTIHHAHHAVISQMLNAGKPVHTEKPLALTYAEAKELVELADAKGVRLSSAPITYMGEAQQLAWKLIRDGVTGKLRLIYSEVNHGRIESWHPNPVPFYDVGIMFDVGVYPLTMVTALLGPAKSVKCSGKIIYPDRKTQDGTPFTPGAEDFMVAIIEFGGGETLRLTANFYVKNSMQGSSMEFHGDAGSVYLGSFQGFGSPVKSAKFGDKDWTDHDHLKEPFQGIEFGRGVQDLAESILADKPHRASGAQAAHVVEIIEGMFTSMREDRTVELTGTFPKPAPMDWAM
ncbi:MAG: Gfo/Idh/MocA family protein [Opitutales bacterium]